MKHKRIITALLAAVIGVGAALGGCGAKPAEKSEPITVDTRKEPIVIADSFQLPSPKSVNTFEYEPTEAAEKLAAHIEKYFHIDKLEPQDTCSGTFFDSRGQDENGSDIVFQQNTASGSFVYSATFSIPNNRIFMQANDGVRLESKKAELTAKAKAVAAEFEEVAGELMLSEVNKENWSVTTNIRAGTSFDEYSFDTYSFVFVPREKPQFQADENTVVTEQYSGDSFYILLRPDGEVINLYCGLTNAPLKKTGEEAMFTVEQLLAYETAMYESSLDGEGGPTVPDGQQMVITGCRLVYANNGVSYARCYPGVMLSYYLSGDPSQVIEEFEPIEFLRDGI